MHLDLAEKHFGVCAATAGAPERVVRRSKLHIEEIRHIRSAIGDARAEERKAAAAGHSARQRDERHRHRLEGLHHVRARGPAGVADDSEGSWRWPAGLVSAGLGAVFIGAGAWVLASWSTDEDALADSAADRNAAGRIVGIDLQTYTEERERLDGRNRLGTATLAGGVALAALGSWLALTAPDQAAASLAMAGPGGGWIGTLHVRF